MVGRIEVTAMLRRMTIIAATALALCALACSAQPELTGYILRPTSTDTCNPVRLIFTITNRGSTPILSQSPFTDFVYPLYSSFRGHGFRPLPDRYMIGVTLDDGKDGYPFRWGFRGRLMPGRSVTVSGFIAIPEIGYSSDFESDAGGWEAAGFVRVNPVLPQGYRVTLLKMDGTTEVVPLEVRHDQTISTTVELSGNDVLVVSGTARFTRQLAHYRFALQK